MRKRGKVIEFNSQSDFKKVGLIPFNRDTVSRPDLQKSMRKYGFIGAVNLIETDLLHGVKKLYIADGQHRLATASFMDIPAMGIIHPVSFENIGEIVKFIADLNTTSHKWSINDYINSYAKLNFKDYKVLNSIIESYKSLKLTTYTIAVLCNSVTANRGNTSEKIRNGVFEAIYHDEAIRTLELVREVNKLDSVNNRMVVAMHKILHTDKKFNKALFIKKFKENHEGLANEGYDRYDKVFSDWIQ